MVVERSQATTRRAEDNQFQRFFEKSLDLLAIVGDDGYFRDLNPAWERVLGWTLTELKSRPYLDFVHPDDRAGTLSQAQALRARAAVVLFENRYCRKDGVYRALQWTASLAPDGKTSYCVARDVTDFKRIEADHGAQEAWYEALTRNVADGVAVLDEGGRRRYVSPSTCRILGFEAADLLGKPVFDLIHPLDRAAYEAAFEWWLAHPREPLPVEVRKRRGDGTYVPVESIGTNLLDDPTVRGIITTTRDLTERKGAESLSGQMAAIVESSDAAIISVSQEDIVRSWNRAAEALLGYASADVVGKPRSMLIPPELREHERALLARVLKGERLSNHETTALHRDGHRVEVSMTLSAIRDPQDAVTGFSLFLQDRARRARRERERAGLLAVAQAATSTHTLAELANTAVTLLHHQLGYAVTSLYLVDQKTASLRLVANRGADRRELQSMSSYPLEARNPAAAVRTYHEREPMVVDDLPDRDDLVESIGLIRRRGLQTMVSLPVLSGDECLGVLQVVTTVRRPPDIMEQATLETIAYNLAAAIRQKQLFDELQETVRELRRANKELDAFAYSASHDLKEPLRSITNFADFLAQDHANELSEEAREKLARIRTGGLRMHAMLEALLKFSKLGRQLEPDTEFEVEELLQEVREGLDALVAERKAQVDFAQPLPRLRSQRARLNEVFSNLITNGLKFNESPTPRVQVSCGVDNSVATFFVDDNGIGIPAEHRDKLFRLFARLPQGRKYPGTGAGLAIVARCIEQLGGKIWVEDSPLGGARFAFTVPQPPTEVDVALGSTDPSGWSPAASRTVPTNP